MLPANQAVRRGLLAATRNPELAFGKALLDVFGSVLSLLPPLLFAALIWRLLAGASLSALLRALPPLGWLTAGGLFSAVLLSFAIGASYWAGAIPLLAADIEIDRRPPSGNFVLLAARGSARVLIAAALGASLSLLFAAACLAAFAAAVPAALRARPMPLFLAGLAALASAAVIGSVLLDLLARLTLIRSAAFADCASAAWAKAASLLGARLGGYLIVTAAFALLEIIVAGVTGGLSSGLSGASLFDPRVELLALGPRLAIALAGAAVYGWLEVARMGALAALVADAEGLIEAPPGEEPPPAAELVVEALPVEDEPV